MRGNREKIERRYAPGKARSNCLCFDTIVFDNIFNYYLSIMSKRGLPPYLEDIKYVIVILLSLKNLRSSIPCIYSFNHVLSWDVLNVLFIIHLARTYIKWLWCPGSPTSYHALWIIRDSKMPQNSNWTEENVICLFYVQFFISISFVNDGRMRMESITPIYH